VAVSKYVFPADQFDLDAAERVAQSKHSAPS
jgi:hypothetical protein